MFTAPVKFSSFRKNAFAQHCVGSVFQNPHFGGLTSSQSVCWETQEAANV
jgi:hypothetical protein